MGASLGGTLFRELEVCNFPLISGVAVFLLLTTFFSVDTPFVFSFVFSLFLALFPWFFL